MKIVQITAGAGGRICGSCLHDNALVRALRARGRDAILVPAYVPTTTDEENVAERRIVCGGVNVWLQEHVPPFRHTPWWLDRLLDARGLLTWLSSRTAETKPADLGGLTVSTLQGEHGHQRKEVEKLARWLAAEAQPDVVHLSNALLVGLARRVREVTGAKIVCSLSGEDIFIEQIPEPHYRSVRRLLRERAADIDRFVALNGAFARFMGDYLGVTAERIAVVPHGLDLAGFPAAPPDLVARRADRGGRTVPRPSRGSRLRPAVAGRAWGRLRSGCLVRQDRESGAWRLSGPGGPERHTGNTHAAGPPSRCRGKKAAGSRAGVPFPGQVW